MNPASRPIVVLLLLVLFGLFFGSVYGQGTCAGCGSSNLLSDISDSVLTLLIVLNPIVGLVYFSGLTATATSRQKLMIANRSSVVVVVLLLFFAYLGDDILAALGITLHYIMAAGGLFLLVFALKDALVGSPARAEPASAGAQLSDAEAGRIAIVPLAVPVLAGPGAIAVVMILNDLKYGLVATGVAVAIDAAICWGAMLLSGKITRLLRPSFLEIVGKIMDIFVSAIGVAFMIRGITGALGISFG